MGQLEQFTGAPKSEVNESEVFLGKMHAQEKLVVEMAPTNVSTSESGTSAEVNEEFQAVVIEWVGKYAELFSKIWSECLQDEKFLTRAKSDTLTDEDVEKLHQLLVERSQQTTGGQTDTKPTETLH
ncbi:hypothetical protein KC872_04550 [Candidatus Kaiserbacteria bacterium]|nr:hypothetical protein [Candidatus Kaiserbacteria bacterium]